VCERCLPAGNRDCRMESTGAGETSGRRAEGCACGADAAGASRAGDADGDDTSRRGAGETTPNTECDRARGDTAGCSIGNAGETALSAPLLGLRGCPPTGE